MNENEYSTLGYPWLQEFPLESDFLKHIPSRAQRGLSTFDLVFNCLDVDGSYIALGSNVGIVYLFDRRQGLMQKLKDVEFKEEVTCVKLLISLECLVATGFKNGDVLVYKVPFIHDNELESSKIETFKVQGLHTSVITALEWSRNGIMIFSGDQRGLVVCTEIDHLEHQSRSKILRDEGNEVLQLSYNRLYLVISTVFRSLVFSLNNETCLQIGQRERKRFGPFGAILYEKDNHIETVFAARPGQRLWRSDLSGVIQETMIFKDALSDPKLALMPLSTSTNNPCDPSDIQFGHLATYDSKYILVWSDSAIVLIDPEQKSVITCSPKLDPVLGVSTSGNEIYILRGLREIVRIAPQSDPFADVKIPEEPSLVDEILVPLKGLSTFVKERSDSLSLQVSAPTDLFGWLRKKRSESSPSLLGDASAQERELEGDDIKLPEIVNLSFDECIPVQLEAETSKFLINIKEPLDTEYDDIVFKPKKKKKKKVRFSKDTKNNDGKQSAVVDEQNETYLKESPDTVTEELDFSVENNHLSLSDTIDQCDNSAPSPTVNEINVPNNSETLDTNKNGDEFQSLDNVLNGNKTSEQLSTNCNNNLTDTSKCEEIVNFETNNADNINNNNFNQNNDLELEKCDSSCQPKDPELDTFDIYSLPDTRKDNQNNSYTSAVKNNLEPPANEDSSLSSSDSFIAEPPKYGVDWVEYKAPEMLLDLCISNDHIFCVDIRNQLYFSKYPVLGMHWIELPQPAEKIASSPSETVVWALYKGTVYGAMQKSQSLWTDNEWISVARDVISISVEDDCGWYVSSSGKLLVQRNLTSFQPYGYPEKVPCKYVISQVAARNEVLWILSEGGCLYCCKSSNGKSKYQWKQIILHAAVDIDTIHLGDQQTGWMVDSNGIILFKIGVMPDNPSGIGKPWQVESSSYLVQHVTARQKLAKMSVNSEVLTHLIRGKQHICISTSAFGVWFCKTFDHLVYSNQKNIIGHVWEQVIPPSTAASTKWSMIATTNATNIEGALWCVSNNGELFCYCVASKAISAVELPSNSGIKCLEQCGQSLWLLSEEGAIYIRRGITPTCQQGMFWQPLDAKELELSSFAVTSQNSPVTKGKYRIMHISSSPNVVWGCTAEGQVLLRLGSLNPSPKSVLLQAWFPIDEEEELQAVKICVGPLGYPVWIIDGRRNVYAREKVSSSYPFGEKWTLVPELQAQELRISKDAVWLLTESGKIFRRFGVTEKNPCGDYWKQMPGLMDHISVTESDDLWGLRDDSIFFHSSFILNYSPYVTERIPVRSISEEDWEDITADEYGNDL